MNEDLYGLEASGIDPEIAAKMLGAKRKRKVTEAMLQQSMSPMNPNRVASGGIAVPISPFEALAQVAKMYFGKMGMEKADKELAGLAGENQKKVAEAMAGYEKTRMGDPGVQMPTAVDDEGNSNAPNEVAPVKADPRRAIAEAMASPLLQKNALVQNDLKSLQPRVLGRTLVDGMGNTVATDSTWVADRQDQRESRMAEIEARKRADYNKPFLPDGTPNTAYQDYEIKKAAAGKSTATANVSLPPAEKAFGVELAKLDAKELDDMRNSATKAQNGLARVSEMSKLAESGVYSGSFAEGRTGVANFFDTLGVPFDTKKLSNSQEYLKHAKELTLSLLKDGVGNNQISNADLKFVNETVPQLETNPQARKNLINYIQGRLQSSVDRFQAADVYARQNGGLSGFAQQNQPKRRASDANAPRVVDW